MCRAEIASQVTTAAVATPGAVNDFGEPLCGITVLACKSTSAVARDRDGTATDCTATVDDERGVIVIPRCDLLVTETFDSVLLGECALPSIRHARRELLTPTAAVVPATGATCVCVCVCV